MSHTEKPDDLNGEQTDLVPRMSVWQAIPKRHMFRIVFLLIALAGILYLQQKTSAITGCMNETFHAPFPSKEGHMTTHKLRVKIINQDTSAP
jgi:hypothetical protein